MKSLLFVLALSAPGVLVPQGLGHDSEFWNSLDPEKKIVFLQGVYSGLSESLGVMSAEASRQKERDPHWVPPFVHERTAVVLKEYFSDSLRFDYETLADLLDVFYTNPDNTHIDLMTALHILTLHQDGHRRRANEMLLIKQRELLRDR